MKRPFVLALVLVLVAASVVGLVTWLSLDPSGGAVPPGSVRDAATVSGPATARADGVSPDAPADLAAPGAEAAERADAGAPADLGPKVAIEGRVTPPAGCAVDDRVEVYALDREVGVEGALAAVARSVKPRAEKPRERDPFGFAGPEDLVVPDRARLLGRASMAADGRFRLEVPESAQKAHVIAIGRSWYGKKSEPLDVGASGARADLVTLCGAWIEGVAAVPAGHASSEVEDLEVRLRTAMDGMRGNMRGVEGVSRSARVVEGRFELVALDAVMTYDVSAEPERLAAGKAKVKDLTPGQAYPLRLDFLQGGTVRGLVHGADGKPIDGAKVSASQKGQWFGFDDNSIRDDQTGADGAFELVGVAPGKVELKAAADSWLFDKAVKVDVQDGGVTEGVLLTLTRGAAITGTVHWPDGKPGVDVLVDVSFDRSQMFGMGAFNALKGARGEARTDTEGRFRVQGLGPGPFTVEARELAAQDVDAWKDKPVLERRRHEHRARAEGVKPDTEGLALVLRPPSGIRGRVVDAAEMPVAKFTIDAGAIGKGMMAELGQEKRSEPFESETGEFLLAALHDGTWKLSAQAEGFAASEPLEIVLPLAPDAAEIVLRLERAASVRGFVRAPNGNPVAGALVAIDDGQPIWMRAMSSTKAIETRSDESGHFDLTGLKPGRTAIAADHADYARSPELPVDLTAGQIVEDATLVMREGGHLTGEVFHDGKPAPGMMVQVQETTRFSQDMTFTDAAGRFDVAHLDPGSYQVIAMPARGDAMTSDEGEFDPMSMMSSMKMAMADIVDGQSVHLILGAPPTDPVAVTGRVTMAGAGLASATVMFLPQTGKKGLAGFKPVQTKKDGSFALTLDGPGSYSVSVQRMSPQMDAQSVHEIRVDVPEATEHVIDIALPEGRISGRVEGPDGKPLARARVSVVREGAARPGTTWGGGYHELRTDGEGLYDATGIEPGTYNVMAGGSELGGMLGDGSSATGGREVKSGVQVGTGDWRRGVDFRLKTPGVVEITVVDEAGAAVSGAVVFARTESGHGVDSFSFISTDGAGLAKYGGLAPGRYSFRARTTTIASGETPPVRLEEGGKASVKIVLEKGTMVLVKVVDGEKKPLLASVEVLDENGHDVGSQLGLSEIMERFQGGGLDPSEQKFGPFRAGKYKVRVTTESGKTTTKPVTLSGQPERKITIELD